MKKSVKKLCTLLGIAALLISWPAVLAAGASGTVVPEAIIRQPSGAFTVPANGSLGSGSLDLPTFEGEKELRGVWISYLIWDRLSAEETAFRQEVDEILDNCKAWGMNAVFVHVRSHGDAMYPSAIYPWSKFVGGVQGVGPGYDPLQYFIEAAHARGLEFHAWFNPYRITGYLMNWSEVSSLSPAKVWAFDGDPANDRYVLVHDGAYYFNPSAEPVKQMVVDGVREVVRNYDVDGIHFDDYFYPSLDDGDEKRWFDYPEYLASGSSLTAAQWRRDQVSDLVRRVYETVKQEKPQVVFGVSPQGYVEHLRSDSNLFVDIDRWMSEDGFIDYIMPQLYWGFETKTADGSLAPYAFGPNLDTWRELKSRGHVRLYLGLAMYRAGTDTYDYNAVSEWLRRDDILSRQVTLGRRFGDVTGYCFYSYDSFLEPAAQKEVAKLVRLLR